MTLPTDPYLRHDAGLPALVRQLDSLYRQTAQEVNRLSLASLVNAVDDTAAATAGVPVGGLYRNGSVLMIRVA